MADQCSDANRDLLVALRNAAPALIAAARERDRLKALRGLSDSVSLDIDECDSKAYARTWRALISAQEALASAERSEPQQSEAERCPTCRDGEGVEPGVIWTCGACGRDGTGRPVPLARARRG